MKGAFEALMAAGMKERCVAIPAIKKNAAIPDQLVKKLAGETLMGRALDTARACVPADDVITLTDSEEIGLICERAGTRHVRNPELRFNGLDIVAEMRDFLENLALEYRYCIILRPSSPLLTWVDVEDAWRKFRESGADCLITVKRARQRLWRSDGSDALSLIREASGSDAGESEYLLESRALIILDLPAIFPERMGLLKTIPYFLEERGIEIESYQDWWICERLLERRHVVFVVAGYPAIGMGHVYRALMLAHEITAHRITFVCTRESVLAAESLAARDYRVIRQKEESLVDTVLRLRPDLTVNDFLNTDAGYVRRLQDAGSRCVNFEDEGSGAAIADLVVNALDDTSESDARKRCGPEYFCLRDEFVQAVRNEFQPVARTLLITFGGTDQHDFTARVLDALEPFCAEMDIAMRIVAGPGYAHKEELEKRLLKLGNPRILFTWATNVMSRMMEGVDLAVCSAGRTVYELAHMRVPAIVFATHQREVGHAFARWPNGFAFGGLMAKASRSVIRNLFIAMLDPERRRRCWERQNRLSFAGNKERVLGLLRDQLEKSGGFK